MEHSGVIVWLGESDCHDPSRTGGKAAALSRLAGQFVVPYGFCITSTAFARIAPPITLSQDLSEEILHAYRSFPVTDVPVAVRSSAIDEDGALTSFAGVHESFLNMRGDDALLTAIERCLESFFSPRALTYRQERGSACDGVRMAVLVQQQIASDVSIVAFSANPVTNHRDEIVVTASWGLGESLVGGTVTPDTWIVRRATGQLLDERIGDKRRMTVMTLDGCREVDVPGMLRNVPSLSTEQVREVAQLAAQLDELQDRPVDIECAITGGTLYLLQCRPVTTLHPISARADPLPIARC